LQWLEYAGYAGQIVREELDAQSDAVSCCLLHHQPRACMCVYDTAVRGLLLCLAGLDAQEDAVSSLCFCLARR